MRKAIILALCLILASCQIPLRSASAQSAGEATEVPAQYRGLWCEARDGMYYRCREATSESSRLIRRDGFNITEEGDCRVSAVTPIAKGHRLRMRCTGSDLPELVDVNLRLLARGRLHFGEARAAYRDGDPFKLPRGTLMCEAPGGDEEPPEACDTAREAQVVNLWGKPREGWCLIVHWIDSGKPGYYAAAWKAWVDCKNLLPPQKEGERSPPRIPASGPP